MDFTAEQDLLRDSVRRTCDRHAGLDVVRKLENDPVGHPPALWSQLGDLGVLGVAIEEEYDGSAMTMVDAAVIYEEFGRSLVPSPHFVSCILSAGLVSKSSNDELKARLLPQIASGEMIVTVAALEPDRGFGPAGVQLSATADGDGVRLTGTKVHVPFAQAAGAVVVLARTEPGQGADGVIAALVDIAAAGVSLEQQLTVASDPQFKITFDNVPVEATNLVHTTGTWAAWHDTMLDAATLTAAQAAGGARAALELATHYASTREQFNRPLAGFQAISHYLADAITAVDGAQGIAWEAAWERSQGNSIAQLAPMAKRFACRTFREVTATAVQIFGGNGFTVEFDIQLYFRRAKSLQLNNWDDRYLGELIAAEVLG
jgi:alkylation response protein AidB-like acyl-CoA dehydrogenase